LCKRLYRLRKKSGLPDDLKLYGTRHKTISNVLLAGGDLKTASLAAGHANVAITASTYSHLPLEHVREALEKAAHFDRPGRPVR
jgi:site-specific recombinase XerC